jgi:hypothetical protein
MTADGTAQIVNVPRGTAISDVIGEAATVLDLNLIVERVDRALGITSRRHRTSQSPSTLEFV